MDIEPGPIFDMELSSICIMEPMQQADKFNVPHCGAAYCVGSKYSVEPGPILQVEPVVLFA